MAFSRCWLVAIIIPLAFHAAADEGFKKLNEEYDSLNSEGRGFQGLMDAFELDKDNTSSEPSYYDKDNPKASVTELGAGMFKVKCGESSAIFNARNVLKGSDPSCSDKKFF